MKAFLCCVWTAMTLLFITGTLPATGLSSALMSILILYFVILNYEKSSDCGPSGRCFGINSLLWSSLRARVYCAFHF